MLKKPIILCVDDEEIILSSLKNELQNILEDQYDFEFAESSQEALELVADLLAENREFALVISDYLMSGGNGDKLLITLHEQIPKAVKILLTGQTAYEGMVNVVNRAQLYRFIVKPWNREDFMMTILSGLRSYVTEKTIEEQNAKLMDLNRNLEVLVDQRTQDLLNTQKELQEANQILKTEKEQLRIASITDHLTQLYNRAYTLQRLQDEIHAFDRYSEPLCVLMLDIDNFKSVNDRFGHLVGDQALIKVSSAILKSVRNTDVAGRYGGEEFIVIFTHTALVQALKTSERICSTIKNLVFDTLELSVTISGGLKMYEGTSIDEFLSSADALLYQAKRQGKDQIVSD